MSEIAPHVLTSGTDERITRARHIGWEPGGIECAPYELF